MGEREPVVEQNQEQGTNVGDPVATALNWMTDLLERIVPQQGQRVGNENQSRGWEEGEDRALERFLKFYPPKFSGGFDSEIAKNWLKNMVNIFDALKYSEERQLTFAVFQFEVAALSW